MGIKLKPKNETTCAFTHDYNDDKKDINLTHWRAIRETKYEGVVGLFVIAKNFRLYFIPGYTTEMFHEANYCNKTLDCAFTYIKNVLSCRYCVGDGKTDWVEAARGKPPREQMYGYRPKFYRAKKGPVHLITSHDPPWYISSVNLNKGDEYCRHCRGSGLEFAAQNTQNMHKRITLEHS